MRRQLALPTDWHAHIMRGDRASMPAAELEYCDRLLERMLPMYPFAVDLDATWSGLCPFTNQSRELAHYHFRHP